MTDQEAFDKWRNLLALAEDAYEAGYSACYDENATAQEKQAASRHWWSAVNAVLWYYVRTHAQERITLEPMPAKILVCLANLTEELSNGNVSELISDVHLIGRPGTWRKERHDIARAIYYVEAVRRGEIVDRHPIKTVREAYGVVARTVQRWVKQRDALCIGVPGGRSGYAPTDTHDEMINAGRRYSIHGRGLKAKRRP